MKLVINKCYGGFDLSPLAIKKYLERKGKQAFFYKSELVGKNYVLHLISTPTDNRLAWNVLTTTEYLGEDVHNIPYELYFTEDSIERNDPDLVAVVEELGGKANSDVSNLHVVDIPDGVAYVIENYDGFEHVAESHRTWG